MPAPDTQERPKVLNLVDASIKELLEALRIGAVTSVQLVALYLHRIGQYDCRGPSLNSVCVLNPNAFEEAQKSDDYRASGRPPRPLEGIPCTVKNSFMVKGMTVAAGSPAFADLIATDDAAVVSLLREAGAVILGLTNMPAMADGGSQRGLYGRAESPYNLQYSTTAFASGSSNGCGTATAASLAAFGLAGETVSSGRAPASNNALIGYSPSRGVIPNRGQWPLYPTCDVIVPHTRSMEDLFAVLNVIVADDGDSSRGIDFWRNQQIVPIPKASEIRPKDYRDLADPYALVGKRVAIPRCFLGDPSAKPFHVCTTAVKALWDSVQKTLESLGATVIATDFPLLEKYTKKDFPGQSCNVPGLSHEWTRIERYLMIATAWEDLLQQNGDVRCTSLSKCDPGKIHPLIAPMDDPSRFTEAQNQVRYSEMIESIRDRQYSLYDLPGIAEAVRALEDMRKRDLEDWMDAHGIDLLAFPTNGDVSYANSDEVYESMLHALQDGVKYSNGGRALKHLGIPCITVPMGTLSDTQMPVGMTLASRAWADNDLLRYAYAYEVASRNRTVPRLTPPLSSDSIPMVPLLDRLCSTAKPFLNLDSATWKEPANSEHEVRREVSVKGTMQSSEPTVGIASLEVFVDGKLFTSISLTGEKWEWNACLSRAKVVDRYPTIGRVPKDCFLVIFIATLQNGRNAARMLLVD